MTTPDPDLDDAALARLGHHELSAILASLYARLARPGRPLRKRP